MPLQPSAPHAPRYRREVLHLRRTYHLGPIRVVWYLERYHGITIRKPGLPHPPASRPESLTQSRRSTSRAHAPVRQAGPWEPRAGDVTFLKLVGKDGRATRRYQYTALDDATRIRALEVYTRHTQKNAMHFLDYVIKKFPFRCIRYGPTVAMSSKPSFLAYTSHRSGAVLLHLGQQNDVVRAVVHRAF